MSDTIELKDGKIVYIAYPGTSGVYHAGSVLKMANNSAKRRGDHIELLRQYGQRLALSLEPYRIGMEATRAWERAKREWDAVYEMNTMEASKTMLALVGLEDDDS